MKKGKLFKTLVLAGMATIALASCDEETFTTPAVQSTTEVTSTPTSAPTSTSTSAPTSAPTSTPTSAPTSAPTSTPTSAPTSAPTSTTTNNPVQKYTVSFKGDGVSISSQTIEEGKLATKPNDPTLTGHKFIGWYTDNNVLFDFSTPITTNVVLTAKWEKETVQLTVTYINGESVYFTSSVLEGQMATAPESPIKQNATFIGWFESLSDENPFDFDNPIMTNLTLYAKFEELTQTFNVDASGYNEGIWATWEDSDVSKAKVEYKATKDSTWTQVDSELVRQISSTTARVDVLGLKAGNYDVRITSSNSKSSTSTNIEVGAHDRSGFAHYNYTNGVGAYTDNGELKSGTIVVYVNDSNKNTVTAKIAGSTYTGIVNILNAQAKSSVPLCVRIVGKINAATWNPIVYGSGGAISTSDVKDQNGNTIAGKGYDRNAIYSNNLNSKSIDIANGITELNGLTDKISYSSGEFDSYYNMCDVKSVKNVTVEGIGTDATLYQWGFTWSKCSSIEIRNLTFDDYTEDACSFEGATDSSTYNGFTDGNIWVHNNTFEQGKNNWDVCPEQDKRQGDGATDFKKNKAITLSYNHYRKNKKTGLVGGSDAQKTGSITFHHNYYEQCSSRLPLGRQAMMHMYNNYYYKSSGTNMSLRAGAYALIEACYFEGVNNPIETKTGDGKTASAKVYNSVFSGCSGTNKGTVVTSRTATVSNQNIYNQKFDTDSSIFYYDSQTQTTKVSHLTTAEVAKEETVKYAGVLKTNGTLPPQGDTTVTPEPTITSTITFNSNGGSSVSAQTVSQGSTLTSLPTPTKSGYKFEGWYLDSSFNSKFTTATVISSDITVYAKWTESSSPSTGETLYNFNSFSSSTYASKVTGADFNITASSGKTISIADCNATYGDITFTNCLKTGGTGSYGSNGYRAVEFDVTAPATITIYYCSAGASNRGVMVLNASGDTLGTSDLVDGSQVYAYTIEITTAQTIYIMSQNSNLIIYGFGVKY